MRGWRSHMCICVVRVSFKQVLRKMRGRGLLVLTPEGRLRKGA
jgi:hypothetical protein